MPRGVGNAEAALGRGEEAVSDIDRDALLALGFEAVGEKRQIHFATAAIDLALLDGFDLVFIGTVGVEKQATDQSAFTVVNATGGGEA